MGKGIGEGRENLSVQIETHVVASRPFILANVVTQKCKVTRPLEPSIVLCQPDCIMAVAFTPTTIATEQVKKNDTARKEFGSCTKTTTTFAFFWKALMLDIAPFS